MEDKEKRFVETVSDKFIKKYTFMSNVNILNGDNH